MKLRSFLVLLSLFSLFPLSASSDVSGSSSTGILVPLYTPPTDNGWNIVLDAKGNHTNVPFVVIVNPNNGPDATNCTMSPYQAGINRLQEKGITVLGYVYTQWGNRPLSGFGSAEQDIDSWKKCYPTINGVFFDEMNTISSSVDYYKILNTYSKLQNFSSHYVFGNPGQDISPDFIGSVDTLVVFENPATMYSANLLENNIWHKYYDKKNFAFLLFDQPNMLNSTMVGNYSNHIGYMYVTDNPGNGHSPYNSSTTYPWNTTSTYLMDLAADLDKKSTMLSVRSVNLLGIPISGYYVQINQSGNWIPSGFTPLDYNATSGIQYLITANSFGNCIFDHWQDATENASRLVLVNSTKITLTAVYKNHNGICL